MKSVVCPDCAIHLLIMANTNLLYEGVPNLPANGDPDQLGQVIRPAIRPHSRALLLLPHQPRLLLPAAGRGLHNYRPPILHSYKLATLALEAEAAGPSVISITVLYCGCGLVPQAAMTVQIQDISRTYNIGTI